MEQNPEPTQENPPAKQPSSARAAIFKAIACVLAVALLSISARRESWLCPACGSTKDTVSWRILFFIPLSEREENLKEQPADEHPHDWELQSYTERMLLGLLFQGLP